MVGFRNFLLQKEVYFRVFTKVRFILLRSLLWYQILEAIISCLKIIRFLVIYNWNSVRNACECCSRYIPCKTVEEINILYVNVTDVPLGKGDVPLPTSVLSSVDTFMFQRHSPNHHHHLFELFENTCVTYVDLQHWHAHPTCVTVIRNRCLMYKCASNHITENGIDGIMSILLFFII